jgi:hypothetical protein
VGDRGPGYDCGGSKGGLCAASSEKRTWVLCRGEGGSSGEKASPAAVANGRGDSSEVRDAAEEESRVRSGGGIDNDDRDKGDDGAEGYVFIGGSGGGSSCSSCAADVGTANVNMEESREADGRGTGVSTSSRCSNLSRRVGGAPCSE